MQFILIHQQSQANNFSANTFNENSASSMGGAIFINNSTSQNQDLTIVGGTLVKGNTSGFGGAVATQGITTCLFKQVSISW